ncbi:uncharacterized protein [Bombus fervidus]|uniref:uncharacterized protein n=1 Tax=Bombus fervidus TaxID=203811 RepID=UPI003D188C56
MHEAIKRSGAIEGREKARGRTDGERLALKRRRGTDKRRSRDVSSARILQITDSSKCGTAGGEKFLSSIRRRHTWDKLPKSPTGSSGVYDGDDEFKVAAMQSPENSTEIPRTFTCFGKGFQGYF